MILILSKEKDVSELRRLLIESFFNAQTSMEIFGGKLVRLFSIGADVNDFYIEFSAQSQQTIFGTFFPGLICIKHADYSFMRA